MKRNASLVVVLVLGSLVLAGCAQAATAVPPTQSAPAIAAATPMPASTASPTPTAEATTTAASVTSLVGHYLMPGPINWLDLTPDGHDYRPDGYGTYTVSGDRITFVDARDCIQPGVYHWSLDENTLRFEKVEEPCMARWRWLLGSLTRLPAQPYVQVEWLTHGQTFSSTAVGAQGNVYAVSGEAKTITKYGPGGQLLATLGGPGTGDGQFMTMGGAAVDSQGNLYVADLGGVRIEEFDASGKYLTSFKPQARPGPVGVAVDAQRNVYVALHGLQDHYVERWSPDGKLLATWGSTGSGDGQFTATDQDSGPRGIAVGAEGQVYVTDPDANRVQAFDANGKFLLSLTGDGDHQFLYPFSVGVDPEGTLYVQNDDGELFAFDATGKPAGLWRAPAGASVRFDAAGNLLMLIGGDVAKITLPQS